MRYTGQIFLWAVLGLWVVGCEKASSPSSEPTLLASPQVVVSDEQNNVDVFRKASPSTVFITNRQLRRDWFTMNVFELPRGTGTGFVWSKKGVVVTNAHVIEGASRIMVGLSDHTTWEATVVGLAPSKDMAVLKINAPAASLLPLPIGSSENLEVGRKVLAIGNPFGLDYTLTTGIISALGREINAPNGRTIRGVIQTDAAINPGNSGGPLLDSSGRLIGINTAIIGPGGGSAGIGFAVPVSTVKKVVPQLLRYGKLIRPVLGVELVDERLSQNMGINGVVVLGVSQGAKRAGLRGISRKANGELVIGDVIIGLGGKPVRNHDDLLSFLEQAQAGEIVEVETLREGVKKRFKVRLSNPD